MDALLLQAVVAPSGNPLIETFTETFSGAFDSNVWETLNTTAVQTVTQSGGDLVLTPDGDINTVPNYVAARTKKIFKLQGSRVWAPVVPLDSTFTSAITETYFMAHDATYDTGAGFVIQTSQTVPTLLFRTWNNITGDWSDNLNAGIAYNASTMAVLGIRESAGTIYWETAPLVGGLPGTWTVRASALVSSFPNFDFPMLLQRASVRLGSGFWDVSMTNAAITQIARIASVNATTANGTAYVSAAMPAAYASAPNIGSDFVSGISNANPATYGTANAPATARVAVGSVALPAGYSATPANTADSTGVIYSSVAGPAGYAMAPVATSDTLGLTDNANPASYGVTAQPTSDLLGTRGNALAATYATTPAPATGNVAIKSNALAAVYATTAFAATVTRAYVSIANPATYATVGAATLSRQAHDYVSFAGAAAYSHTAAATKDTTTGIETVAAAAPLPLAPPIETITAAQFNAWLRDESARRIILLETSFIDSDGNIQPLYFASSGYVSRINDTMANRYYAPLIRGGLDFEQKVNLDLTGDLSYGDIELDNTEGDLDYLFGQQFQYQPVKGYVGDASWPRGAFRQIFDGTIEDIDSSSRDAVNVKLREKMWKLDTPLHDFKVGGTTGDPEALLPVTFGECHNVTPVLLDTSKLRYAYHVGMSERIIEVRDNGIPIQISASPKSSPAYFELIRQPYGRITCSVQGDYTPNNGYVRLPFEIIFSIVTGWGTEPTKRLTADDIDTANFLDFQATDPAPIGIYITERMTVLEAAQTIAASVGARLTQTIDGRLRLIKLQVPPPGSPIQITQSDMVAGSLQIVNRLPLVPAVKLGYCKNWTVQEDTAAGIPEDHRKLYAKEFLSISAVNEGVRTRYNLPPEPPQEETLLLSANAATLEVQRRLRLRSEQRHVVEFTGYADLMLTEVGSPIQIVEHPRFPEVLSGKTGQVISVRVDWMNSRVTLQALF